MFVAMVYTRACGMDEFKNLWQAKNFKEKKEAEKWLEKIMDEVFDPEEPEILDLYQTDIVEVKND